MKSRNRWILIPVTVVLFLSIARPAAATTQIKPVNSFYNVEVVYNEKLAYIGNRNLELKITVSSPSGVVIPEADRLTLIGVQAEDNPEIKIKPEAGSNRNNVYVYNVDLREGLEPRTYKLTLDFRDFRNSSSQTYVNLDVGVRRNGRLRFIETAPDSLVLSAKKTIKLKFANDYPDYTVNINKIKIDSVPSGLIDSIEVNEEEGSKPSVRNNVILFDPGLSIDPAQQRSLEVTLKVGGMPSFQGYIMGFTDDSKLTFEVTYDDSRGRSLSDLPAEMKVKVRPNDRFLGVALFVGLLLGTGIKFYLEYLRKRGAITKKGVAGFIVITLLVGVIVVVITWVGEIQIIAFKKVDLSYDKPGVIFILGCAGALSGVHFLHKWLKFLAPGEK